MQRAQQLVKMQQQQQKSWPSATSAQYITDEMLAPFVSNSGLLPTSQVELSLSCRNLINADIITKSDPYCIVWMQEPRWQDKYYEIARTEVIDDNLNPSWVKKILLSYNFESVQKLKFEIWDEDINDSDFLGRFETTLGDLVSLSGREFIGKLTGVPNRNCGEIIIVTEEVSSCKQIAEIYFRAEDLLRLSWIWSNDPFLVISKGFHAKSKHCDNVEYLRICKNTLVAKFKLATDRYAAILNLVFSRSNEDGSHSVVAKTEFARSGDNPTWRPILIRVTTLCNGDYDRNIKIDCYDHRQSGSHKLIGTCHTSLRTMNTTSGNQTQMILVHEKKRQKNPNKGNAGVLKIDKIVITEEISFLDYIRNGTQLHFAVAIDFTASNGVFTDPKSLHHLSPYRLNSYEIALRAIGEIIQQYDSSLLFPAFGFGAKIPPSGQVSHQFPLNGNPAHPFCNGVDEILNHYRNQLKSVTLYGPTNFSPVIANTTSIAGEFQDGKHYFVLLIITDGIISDMHLTKHAIVNASSLPISIIIVGVGDADFENMDVLDSDDVRLSVDGRYAERDIVQFVPLNKFLTKNGSTVKSQAELAKEVLAEIPEQLTSFMKSRNIKPQKNSPDKVSSPTLHPTAPMSRV